MYMRLPIIHINLTAFLMFNYGNTLSRRAVMEAKLTQIRANAIPPMGAQ